MIKLFLKHSLSLICLSFLIAFAIFVFNKKTIAKQCSAVNITDQNNIIINHQNFPDETFRSWLISPNNIQGLGADVVLTKDELSLINKINITSEDQKINDLTRIEHFFCI